MKLDSARLRMLFLRWQGPGVLACALVALMGFVASQLLVSTDGVMAPSATVKTTAAQAASSALAASAGAANVAGREAAKVPSAEPLPEPSQDARSTDRMWEVAAGAAPVAPGVALAETWRIGGLFETEQGPSVIVVFDRGSPSQYLRVGDHLPNKAEIVAIRTDAVIVRTPINKRWVLVALDL